jgi:hypothetical protein
MGHLPKAKIQSTMIAPMPGINVIKLIAPFWPVFLKMRQKMKIIKAKMAKANTQYPSAKAEKAAATEELPSSYIKYSSSHKWAFLLRWGLPARADSRTGLTPPPQASLSLSPKLIHLMSGLGFHSLDDYSNRCA